MDTQVYLFDTTLRDGTQSEGLSLSVDDKLKIAGLLDGFGVHYIEGGWPGSNPKDAEFFRRARSLALRHAKLVAFGATRKAGVRAEEDPNLRALLAAETPKPEPAKDEAAKDLDKLQGKWKLVAMDLDGKVTKSSEGHVITFEKEFMLSLGAGSRRDAACSVHRQ